MLETVPADDDARVGAFGETARISFFRVVKIEHVDVVAVRHDRADALLVETQHVGNDGLLALVEHAGLGALLHQHVDLVVGHRRIAA